MQLKKVVKKPLDLLHIFILSECPVNGSINTHTTLVTGSLT